MAVIEEVLQPLGEEWNAMTFPSYRHALRVIGTPETDAEGSRPIACTATIDGRPAGLLLARFTAAAPRTAEMLSLFVAPDVRGQGIGTALVARMEQSAHTHYGATDITGTYMTGKPSIAAVERIFEKRGFTPPEMRTVVLRFTPEEASRTVWYSKARLPQDAVIFPWTELTAEERQELIRSQAEEHWIHPDLEPWRFDEGFDPVSSLGLRLNGKVIGWIINHRLAPDLLRITVAFMRKDHDSRGATFALHAASLSRLPRTGIWVTYVTAARFERMVAFTRKRCAPFASFAGETRAVTKVLS